MKYLKTPTFAGFILSFLSTSTVLANPIPGNVASGNVIIQQTPNTTTINQSSHSAIINWQSFNIGSQQATHFYQPSGGITLNRISPDAGVSQIYGTLTATGQIILVNPAGIYFGPGAYVNVGGLIATTSNITDKNFLSGNYIFDQPSTYVNPSIINEGTIIAANHGLIALVGPNVTNNGLIQADLGHVVLASGDAYTINFAGDDLVNFAFDETPSSRSGSVTNNGSLIANGGHILVTAQQTSNVLDNAINLNGVVQAQSVYKHNGEIVISGDPNGGVVNIAANIKATGKKQHQTGGTVDITGYDILLNSPTSIDVSGDAGGGTINIGGNEHGQGVLPNANAVVMDPGATLNASAITNGNGGNIVLWSNYYTNVMGNIFAMGGSQGGNGGFVETSSHNILNASGVTVNTSAAKGKIGTWLLDPANVTISTAADSNYQQFITGIFQPDSGVATANVNNTVNTDTLDTALNNNSVEITTTNNGADGGSVGNITVLTPITWTSNSTLTLLAANDIILDAAISGIHGSLSLSAANTSQSITTDSSGTVNVANFNLIQGQWYQVNSSLPAFTVSNNFQINNGSIPTSVAEFIRATSGTGASGSPYVVTDVYGLQGIGSDATTVADSWALGGNIAAASTATWNNGAGFVPIGNESPDSFSGTFAGQGHTIDGLTIDTPTTAGFVGLFSTVTAGGVLSNVSLTNVNIIGNTDVGALVGFLSSGQATSNILGGMDITGTVTGSGNFVGGLVGNGDTVSAAAQGDITVADTVTETTSGSSFVGGVAGQVGTINNVVFSGNVAAPTASFVGGLAGQIATSLTNSYLTSTASVDGNIYVGGLVGNNEGSISNSYNPANVIGRINVGGIAGLSSGSINQVYNLGYISNNNLGAPNGFGGIVGNNSGTLTNAYNNGEVNTEQNGQNGTKVGGVIGIFASGTIGFLYNTGDVIGSSATGGLIGTASSTPTFMGMSYWNSDTSGQTLGASNLTNGNIVGANTAQMTQQSTFLGWDFVSTWNIINGSSYPVLRFFYPSVANLRVITSTSTTPAAEVDLADNGTLIDQTYTGSNGAGYFLEGVNALSGLGTTIADNAPLFLYFDNSGSTVSNAVALAPTAGGQMGVGNGFSLASNTLTAGLGGTAETFSNTSINSAVNGNSNALFSLSGNDLILNSGISFATTTPTTYDVVGNLNAATGAVNLAGAVAGGGNAFTVTVGSSSVISGIMSNLTNFTKAGTGTLTLSGNNTYSGTTAITGGQLDISSDSNLGTAPGSATASDLVLSNGGILDATTGFTLNSNRGISLGTGGGTLMTAAGNTLNYGGILAGSGPLTIGTGGTVVLSGANTYTGSTTVTGSQLNISSDSNLGTAPGSATAGDLVLSNGGILDTTTGFTLNSNRGISLGTGGGTLMTALGNTLNYGGILAGSGALTISGGGTLALSGTNTYTGSTTINGSQLDISADNNLGTAPGSATAADLVLSNGGILDTTAGFTLNSHRGISLGTGGGTLMTALGNTLNYGGILAGSGPLTLNGGGTFVLSGANTYTGSTTINGSQLDISADNNLGTAPGSATASDLVITNGGILDTTAGFTLNSNRGISLGTGGGTLTTALGHTLNYGGILAGSGPLTLSGGGTFVLSGANTYSGSTTVAGSQLNISSDSNLGAAPGGATASDLVLSNGGILDATTGFTLNSNRGMSLGTGGGTLMTAAGNTLNYGGILAGSGPLTIGTGGTVVLSGANIYTGSTTVTGSQLDISADNNLGTAPGSATASDLVLSNGGILDATTGFTLNSNRGISLGTGGGTLITAAGNTLNYAGIMAGSGALTISGGGTLALSGTNTYTGSTTINGSQLDINADNNLGTAPGSATAGDLVITNGGILDTTTGFTLNSNRGISLGTGGGTLMTALGNTLNYAGILAGSGALTISGGGTLALSGTNTYTGSTTINGSQLDISADNNLGTAPGSATAGDLLLSNGGILDTTTGFTLNSNRGISLGTGGGTLMTALGNTLNYGGILAGSGPLTLNGGGTFVLSGANTYTGSTTINGSQLDISADNNLGTAPGSATAGDLVITNGGILDTTAGFTLNSNRGISLGTGGGTLTTALGHTLNYGGILAGSGPLTLSGGGTFVLSGANTYSGSTTVAGSQLNISSDSNLGAAPGGATASDLVLSNGGILDATTGFTLNSNRGMSLGTGGGTLMTAAGNTLNYGGILAGSGPLTIGTGGTVVLSGANIYTGSTTVTGSQLDISADNNLGTAPGSATASDLVLSNGGILDATTGFTLNSNRGISLGTGGGTLITAAGNTLNYAGIMAGSGALTISGGGTLALSGTNTYTGSTTINGSQLDINADNNLGTAPGSATAGDLVITNGGILDTTTGFTLNSNRGISLGTGGGTLMTALGNTLNYGGILAGSGPLTLNGGGTFVLSGANTYTGSTTINGSQLDISADNNLGTAPGSSTAGDLVITNGGILDTTAGFTLNSNRGISLGTGGGTLMTALGHTLNYGGIVAGSGPLTLNGGGTFVLSGANTYTGSTTINGSQLDISADNNLGTAPGSMTPDDLVLSNGGILDATASFTLNSNRGISLGTGGGALMAASGNTLGYGGVLAGSGALTIGGSGAVILSGANTFTGATSVLDGSTLQLANSSALQDSSSVNIGSVTGATLALSGGINVANDMTFSTGSTISENNANTTDTLSGNLAMNGLVAVNVSNATNDVLDLSGVISGTGITLTKGGAGTLVLGGTNTYTGTTSIIGGQLDISSDSNLGAAPGSPTPGDLALSGGGILDATSSFTLDSNRGIALGAGGGTFTTNSGVTLTLPGIITGTGTALNKEGTGTLDLTGANTYTGTTSINAGTLVAGNNTALGSAGSVIANNGTTLTLDGATISNEAITLNGATLNGIGTAGLANTSPITLASNTSNVIDAVSGNFNLDGAIDGATAGNTSLTLQGAGDLTLGANIGSINSLSSLIANTLLNLGVPNIALTATTINLNDGVYGVGDNLALNGTNLSVIGDVALNDLTFTGTGANNTLTLDTGTGGTQTWNINGANSGTVTSNGITGNAMFNNVQNIIGGSGANNFTVSSGGSLSGNISGGSGNNTLIGTNVPTVWNIMGTNQVSISGVSGVLNNIQNLVGGTDGNQFIFANNGSITGTINGGSLSQTNTLNFQAYTTPVNVTVTSNNKFNGSATNNNQVIASYTNINNLLGNASTSNTLNLSALSPVPAGQLVINGLSGSLADPLTWMGYTVIPPGIIPTPAPEILTESELNGPNVSPIIQQPDSNTRDYEDTYSITGVDQNIDEINAQAQALTDNYLNSLKIYPNCQE